MTSSKSHRRKKKNPRNPDTRNYGKDGTDLPTGIVWEPRNRHAVRSSPGPWRGALLVAKAGLAVSSPTGKLDGEALPHEVGSVFLG